MLHEFFWELQDDARVSDVMSTGAGWVLRFSVLKVATQFVEDTCMTLKVAPSLVQVIIVTKSQV